MRLCAETSKRKREMIDMCYNSTICPSLLRDNIGITGPIFVMEVFIGFTRNFELSLVAYHSLSKLKKSVGVSEKIPLPCACGDKKRERGEK